MQGRLSCLPFFEGTDCDENTGAAAFCSKNKNRGIPCQKIVICVDPYNLWFVPTSYYIPLPCGGVRGGSPYPNC